MKDKLLTDPEAIQPYLEDSAHFPGGHSPGVYRPKNEAELISILKQHHASGQPLVVQGARTSLTGGATPFGENVLSLENFNQILKCDRQAIVQPFVRLKELNDQAAKNGLFYPPTPTYDLATIGGAVATCAAGSATFKYGTTRDWVLGLRLVLSNGDILNAKRGQFKTDSNGLFELISESGKKITLQTPLSYQTPKHLKKVSCGYMAGPDLDFVDFVIGSEGTLGVVTEIQVKLAPKPESVLSGIAFFNSEESAFEFVKIVREDSASQVRAMEFMDQESLNLIRESEIDKKLKVPLPDEIKSAIYFECELNKQTTSEAIFSVLEDYTQNQDPNSKKPETSVEKLFYRLQQFSALNPETLVLALPEDTEMLEHLKELREAVPQLINEQIGRFQASDPKVTKIAADVIVPFERLPEMVHAFRDLAKQALLKVVVFGHISDGNLHPNILVKNSKEVHNGMACLRQAIKQVIELGGAPMAEHGVGRNSLKQEFLKHFYGEKGVREMAQAKLTLDPRGIFSPGVIFSKEYLKTGIGTTSLKVGSTIKDVGDEQGELWQFSLKSLTKAQNFVNGFLARFLVHNPKALRLMEQIRSVGHKTSGYMTDYISIPYSAARIRELKRRGFIQDKDCRETLVFRHIEGIFPPFLIRKSFLEPIDPEVIEENIPIEYEFDEEDIWVPLKDVWSHLPALEDNYEKMASEEFPFISESEIPEIVVAWRVGKLNKFRSWFEEIQGGPFYKKGIIPKLNDQETQLVLVERKIGLYNGFDTSGKSPKPNFFQTLFYTPAKFFYLIFYEFFIFLFGMERLVSLLNMLLGYKWTRHLLNEVHDAEWIRNTPKGKKDKENIESILGKGGWNIFVDHRTLRRSLLPHLCLLDRLSSLIGQKPLKPMGQNEVCYRILKKLGMEKHEDYIPNKNSDWKARVMRDRDKFKRKTRSQLAYFLDEALPGRRGNIATYAAFWGATTGWGWFDFLLAFIHLDWGPDPWFFHHIAIEGNFERLAQATEEKFSKGEDYVTPDKKIKNAGEVGFLDRFSFMWFLRQVFSKEVRYVSNRRLQALYLSGRLTRKEYDKYLSAEKNKKTIVEGPHIEIIDRRSGIPWFNQVRVSQAIETSSEIRVEEPKTENNDLLEPWKIRVKNLFGHSRH